MKAVSRCKTCAYSAADHNGGVQGCAYIQITGQSRLKEVYQRLGVNHLTPAVREAMKPENCLQYKRGSQIALPEKRIVLPGSLPKKAKPEAQKKQRLPRPRKWDEDAAMELWKQGMTDPEIAKCLGLATSTILLWRKDMHLMHNYKVTRKTSVLLPLWNKGLSDREIAKESGLALDQVKRWRNKRGLKRHPEPEELQKAAEMARRRQLWDEGKTDREIAETLGIKIRTVVTWRWNRRLPENRREANGTL